METTQEKLIKKLHRLIMTTLALQALVIVFVCWYGGDISAKDAIILKHTSSMVEDHLPRLSSDLASVSTDTREVKAGVAGLHTQVGHVREKLGVLGETAARVEDGMKDIGATTVSFFNDKSGVIWGHSLNPYILAGALVLILTGIAVCGILFVRQKIAQENSSAQTPDESIHRRLEDLTVLMEKIRSQENSGSADPELKRIMEETERLINDARTMLLSEKTENRPEDVDPQMLH